MQRSRHNTPNSNTSKDIQTLASMVVARAQLASKLGMQYGSDRDLYEVLGYKGQTELKYEDYWGKYSRHDIAKAIIDRPVRATWQGQLELIESEEAEKTPFEQAWYDLNKRLKLRSLLARVDRLTGIGRYGILFLGLDDVGNAEGLIKPVSKGKKALMLAYVKPFGENSAKIDKYEDNPKDERYGLPLTYSIDVQDVANNASRSIKVHHSRCIHILEDHLESDVFGIPRLEAVFNRLMDLEKLVGGDAEMFWRGARPGYQGVVDKDYQMTQTTKDDLKDQLDEMEHNLRRYLVNEGVELKALAQEIADPKSHFDVQIACISAVTGIPQRILSGSERGELASSQDAGEWKTYVQGRREDHAEPHIIQPFTDRLIELGILPEPENGYMVDWLDLFSISEKDRVEIGKARANALREYTYNPMAQSIIPPKVFYEYFLGFSQPQIDLTEELLGEGISEEQKELAEEIKEMEKVEEPVVPGQVAKPASKPA